MKTLKTFCIIFFLLIGACVQAAEKTSKPMHLEGEQAIAFQKVSKDAFDLMTAYRKRVRKEPCAELVLGYAEKEEYRQWINQEDPRFKNFEHALFDQKSFVKKGVHTLQEDGVTIEYHLTRTTLCEFEQKKIASSKVRTTTVQGHKATMPAAFSAVFALFEKLSNNRIPEPCEAVLFIPRSHNPSKMVFSIKDEQFSCAHTEQEYLKGSIQEVEMQPASTSAAPIPTPATALQEPSTELPRRKSVKVVEVENADTKEESSNRTPLIDKSKQSTHSSKCVIF